MNNGNGKILGGEEYFARETIKDSTEEIMRVLTEYEYSIALGMNSEGDMELFVGGKHNTNPDQTMGVCIIGMIQTIKENGNELVSTSLISTLNEMLEEGTKQP